MQKNSSCYTRFCDYWNQRSSPGRDGNPLDPAFIPSHCRSLLETLRKSDCYFIFQIRCCRTWRGWRRRWSSSCRNSSRPSTTIGKRSTTATRQRRFSRWELDAAIPKATENIREIWSTLTISKIQQRIDLDNHVSCNISPHHTVYTRYTGGDYSTSPVGAYNTLIWARHRPQKHPSFANFGKKNEKVSKIFEN